MTKQTYVPTEADRLTGENVRKLRRLTGETLVEVIEGSGVGIGQSSLSRIELGQRALTMPEATKLAAYWNTTPAALYRTPPLLAKGDSRTIGASSTVQTEQQFLGNDTTPPALFAVPDLLGASAVEIGRTITIDLDAPLTPDNYRAQVWIPYLENRYNTEQKAG